MALTEVAFTKEMTLHFYEAENSSSMIYEFWQDWTDDLKYRIVVGNILKNIKIIVRPDLQV